MQKMDFEKFDDRTLLTQGREMYLKMIIYTAQTL